MLCDRFATIADRQRAQLAAADLAAFHNATTRPTHRDGTPARRSLTAESVLAANDAYTPPKRRSVGRVRTYDERAYAYHRETLARVALGRLAALSILLAIAALCAVYTAASHPSAGATYKHSHLSCSYTRTGQLIECYRIPI